MTGLSSLGPPGPDLVVVDTDVGSFLFKRDSRAARYEPHLLGKISAQARAELCSWPNQRNWGATRRQELEQFLTPYVIEYPDDRLCRLYGETVADARKRGYQVPASDAWHAVTALSLGVPLVTHNARNFQGIPALSLIFEPDP